MTLNLKLLLPILLFAFPAMAVDAPFNGPANWGATGLMETPNARVLEYGKYRFGASQVEPYRYYYSVVSPLPGLEIGGRVTEVMGTSSPDDPRWKNYGNYKDKAIDIKYRLLPEGKYWPAIAVGIMDPHGTRVYGGQYLVASKQIYPFDFTIGVGNGRFGREQLPDGEFRVELIQDPKQFWSDAQIFGGIEFSPSSKFSLMVEYNPIRYEIQTRDPAQPKYFTDGISSRINVGVRIRPVEWAEVDLSYQRGNQIGIAFSMAFNIAKPFLPIYDPPYMEKPLYRQAPEDERIARALSETGFTDIGVAREGDDLWIVAENDRYYYSANAVGAILETFDKLLPLQTGRINIILKHRGIPVLMFATQGRDLRYYLDEEIRLRDYLTLTEITPDIYKTPATHLQYRKYFHFGLKPEIQPFVNDPSGFFKIRAGVSGWAAFRPWAGGSFIVGAEGYLINNISSDNEPLSIPVRSDFISYMEKNAVLSGLMFEQIVKTKYQIHGRLGIGILEPMYAGLDVEVAMPLAGGRFLAGVSGSLVKKRDTANPLKLNNDDWGDYYDTQFVNARLNVPELEMALDVKAGKFLAGDKGARVTVSKFLNGVVLSAWWSFTDTSGFTDPYNRGYSDKGIAVSIPLRMFLGRDSRTVYDYSISPWTRDVAQDVRHRTSLFNFIGRNTDLHLKKDSMRME
jgi:hypothetical protein